MNLVDSNVLLRFLIGDHAAMQQRSKALVDRLRSEEEEAFTTDVVVHEVCYVLSASTHYSLTHQDIRDRLYPILAMPGLHIANESLCLEALNIFF
jgi:predicted nucleic acid-binding protein